MPPAVPATVDPSVHELLAALVAGISRATAPVDATATHALERLFREQEQRRLEPWRAEVQRQEAILRQIEEEDLEAQRAHFVRRARAHLLSPEDVLLATYTLFGSPSDIRLVNGLILRLAGHARIVAHNVFVATRREASFLQIHGERLLKLRFPLFPPIDSLATLNDVLLEEPAAIVGGGSDDTVWPSVFRRGEVAGGAYLVPVTTVDGTPVVDLGPAEDAVAELRRRVGAVERENAELRRARTAPATRPQQRHYSPAPTRGTTNNRYRRGTRGPRGGGDTGAADPEPVGPSPQSVKNF